MSLAADRYCQSMGHYRCTQGVVVFNRLNLSILERKISDKMIRNLLLPSIKFELRQIVAWLRSCLQRASFWSWEVVRWRQEAGEDGYEILYMGRKAQSLMAKALLGVKDDTNTSQSRKFNLSRAVLIAEMWFPGAIKVPQMLGSVVPLGRPIEDITSTFHGQLRRELKRNRERYRLQQVLTDDVIEKVNRDLLQAYASARHGDSASQLKLSDVRKMSQGYGRLDLLVLDEDVVGCQLGHEIIRSGKRYWSTNRCGYPEAIYSDSKRLREANAINIHLAMEWAHSRGFDFYDIGTSLGRPDDGLLEWKRRRGGVVDTLGNNDYLYIRLPKLHAAQFLWNSPLFAVEGRKLILHLGLPGGQSEDQIAMRYREMGFGGLSRVYLHCDISPSDSLLEILAGYFENQEIRPVIECIKSLSMGKNF